MTLTPQAETMHRALRPGMFYAIALLVFLADQVSKLWIQNTMVWGQSRPILPGVFALTLTQNTGGAWGLLPQGNGLFIGFAIVAVVALLLAYHRLTRLELPVGTAFALALGGALGNLLDRLRYGYVVDFFDAQIFRWPIFNIADSAISLGIGLLLLHFLLTARAEAPKKTAPEESH
jgi:signal peptidase II